MRASRKSPHRLLACDGNRTRCRTRLRHAIDGGKSKRLTFRNHLCQLEGASGRFLNTPLQLRNLNGFLHSQGHGQLSSLNNGHVSNLTQELHLW